jgi:TubC N-terminal docking domain
MMSTNTVLRVLASRDIQIEVTEKGDLRLNAPAGSLTQTITKLVSQKKHELIAVMTILTEDEFYELYEECRVRTK